MKIFFFKVQIRRLNSFALFIYDKLIFNYHLQFIIIRNKLSPLIINF